MSGATVSINKKWNDGTLIQVGGVGTEDFLRNLAGFVGTDVADYIVKAIGDSITPASTPGPVSEQQAQQNIQNAFPQSQPAPVQQAPHNQQAPTCQHGARTYREGTGKNGKPWKAWFCPSQDRNNQCEAQWIR